MADAQDEGAGSFSLERTFGPNLKFTCTRCGACCRHVGEGVGLTGADSARLERAVEPDIEHPVFVGRLQSEEGTCTQLSGDDCTVYGRRPLVCRLYPFYLGAKADGTLQLSVDHCPGVDLSDSELVDDRYVKRELLPTLSLDAEYLASLRETMAEVKGEGCPLVKAGATEVRVTWSARDELWRRIFSLMDGAFPGPFTPRDRLECLKADLVPWIEERMVGLEGGGVLDDDAIRRAFLGREGETAQLVARSARAQEGHRKLIQSEGRLTEGESAGFTTFKTRTGERFEVPTTETLVMRELSSEASSAEMSYLKEIVRREFVYGGVAVPPLTLREEASLLFYTSDAIELMANAISVRLGKGHVDIEAMTSAICEADSHVLTTVQGLGVQIPTDFGPRDGSRKRTA